MNPPLIIFSAQKTPDRLTALEQAVVERCHGHGFDCLLIPHLYHVSESSLVWEKLAACIGQAVLVCWLHRRPAEWILRRHQLPVEGLTILNLSDFADADAAATAAMASAGQALPPGSLTRFEAPTVRRWYPVVDGTRCVNCQHCLQFCLFGVYELDAEGMLSVGNPEQCKAGCPACARICPQSAIMFPLYEKDAAIAGAPGRFVTLDLAARRMFYGQARRPCPVCGQQGGQWSSSSATTKTGLCPECGGAPGTPGRRPGTSSAGREPAADHGYMVPERPPFDDLDDLVNQLDQQMQRRL